MQSSEGCLTQSTQTIARATGYVVTQSRAIVQSDWLLFKAMLELSFVEVHLRI